MSDFTPSSDRRASGQAMETAVLFADVFSSSEFASILSLETYSDYVSTFESICQQHVAHFFETFHGGIYQRERDYEVNLLGDELVVFQHTQRHADDVHQLICLAITIKCAWLASPGEPAYPASDDRPPPVGCHEGDRDTCCAARGDRHFCDPSGRLLPPPGTGC